MLTYAFSVARFNGNGIACIINTPLQRIILACGFMEVYWAHLDVMVSWVMFGRIIT